MSSSKEEDVMKTLEELNVVSDSDRNTYGDMFLVFDYNGNGSVDVSDVKQVGIVFLWLCNFVNL